MFCCIINLLLPPFMGAIQREGCDIILCGDYLFPICDCAWIVHHNHTCKPKKKIGEEEIACSRKMKHSSRCCDFPRNVISLHWLRSEVGLFLAFELCKLCGVCKRLPGLSMKVDLADPHRNRPAS
ncbi:hypothetical protein OCU04_005337 [Sclerotinia nivalis]|uniref:Secreted protein n=1 Tax=Sclerotinia nivalis TaxID=352851 RepID=A0A9X0DL38_9HELO|nr:hypothetical protein OCU04_005337 [Sclerotinia nivalis]